MLVEIYIKYQHAKNDLLLYRVWTDKFYHLSIPYLLYKDIIIDVHDFLLNIDDVKFCLLNYKRCNEVAKQYHSYLKDVLDMRLQKKDEKVEFKVYR